MEIYSFGQGRLRKLHHWLTIGGNSMWLWVGAYFLGPIIGMGLVVAAFIFTPYMLWTLYQEDRTGWVVGFLGIVAAPTALGWLLLPISGLGFWVVGCYGLLTFYTFTWALRQQVKIWIERETWEAQLRHKDDQRGW